MVVSLFSKGGGIVLPSTVFYSEKTYLFWFEQIFRRKQRDCAQGYHLYNDEYHKNYIVKCSGSSSALSILHIAFPDGVKYRRCRTNETNDSNYARSFSLFTYTVVFKKIDFCIFYHWAEHSCYMIVLFNVLIIFETLAINTF